MPEPPMLTGEVRTRVEDIEKQFSVSEEFLKKAVTFFIECADKGLKVKNDPEALLMIPTFVTSIPTGKEKGVLLAIDLGGTNFRVVSVALNGDHTFDLVQAKNPIPVDLMKGTSDELFRWMAEKIHDFVKENHSNAVESGNRLKMGFTFSFPIDQTSLDSGTLTRWSKHFNIPDCIGKDVVKLLQYHLDALKVPVVVSALANDTVGTLLARSYTGADKEGKTKIGCIFGTGTNGAYEEDLDNITKLPQSIRNELKAKGVRKMVINTEWGSFDNKLRVLPNTKWDEQVDKLSPNPGFHLFEKRVSGMFMGEILRQILLDLYREGLILQQYRTEDKLPHRLRTAWDLDTEAMSLFEIDDSTDLKASELKLEQMLRLPTTVEERVVIQRLTRAIAHRSSSLAAVPISAILLKSHALDGHNVNVDVGADGSVVEFYPGFRTMMRDAIAQTQLGPKGERRLHVNIAKDGSSVGAALCALSSEF